MDESVGERSSRTPKKGPNYKLGWTRMVHIVVAHDIFQLHILRSQGCNCVTVTLTNSIPIRFYL
jgi:hypothetical protein